MSAENFEERLLQELKRHVNERSSSEVAALEKGGRRARRGRRSPWRFAGGGFGVAVAIGAAVLVADIASAGSPTAQSPSATATATGPLFHMQNAAFAVDAEPSGAVDITILKGSDKPDVNAIRDALAGAGVSAKVLTNVPTCAQLAKSPGSPSPVGSDKAPAVLDSLDHPFFENGDLVYSVDTSADIRGTTLWVMFTSTLSTIFVERTPDTGLQPNCI